MTTSFEFATATRILFGAGAIQRVGEVIPRASHRALVVTGQNPHRADPLRAVLSAGPLHLSSLTVAGEPEIATVEQGAALARQERCDLVIACGGGSVIDAGKAIAGMLTNDGSLLDYLEIIGRGQALTRPACPFLAIPTTAGTGAEVTRNAVLSAPAQQIKVSLRSPFLLPAAAIIDPELTYDLPPALTASTGLDALTQLIEPYVCLRANPLTDGFCAEGIRRAARALPEAVRAGHNPAARTDMSLASLFGGLALANAGLGAVHGLAAPIGGAFPAPHGAVCAALLPHIMAANLRALRARAPASAALPRYRHIAAWLTGDAQATADAGVAWVRELITQLPIPRLGAYGVAEEHVGGLAAKAASASSTKANPIPLTQTELSEALRAAL